MPSSDPLRVGYVVKRYPRYSETFIVNEILAHEAAGLAVEIFALLPGIDTHFQDAISRVRAPVHYLLPESPKASDLWDMLQQAHGAAGAWEVLETARGESVRDLYQAMLLALQVRRRGIDLLHAHFATSPAAVARMASRFAAVPYTFTAHAKDIFHEAVSADSLGRKIADAAAVVTVSDFNAAHLKQEYGVATDRVVRVYNGMDLGLLRYEAPRDRPPLILGVGRLVEKKGLTYLIDACALLAAKRLSFRCVIVGEGELEGELKSRIESLGLRERVELIGPRPQVEVFRLIQSAAVLAAPCVVGTDGNRDGLPTVLLEAMALGTPCVSTDVTGIPEVIRAGQTGLLAPQRDPEALATAIERLLSDGALRVRLAAAARARVEQDFDAATTAAQLRRVFHEVSSRAARPR